MPEELDENRFKKEVMNLLGNLISKANAHDGRFDAIDGRLEILSQKVDSVASQFQDVGSMSIQDHERIEDLEARVGVLEGEAH